MLRHRAYEDTTAISGAFLDNSKAAEVLDFASSPENAEKLWALSEEIIGQKFTY
jgi:hypothetical protein